LTAWLTSFNGMSWPHFRFGRLAPKKQAQTYFLTTLSMVKSINKN